ncbi:MAG: zinc ribbon domain-containing protein [Planctomycetes bacterium]|nr:zinc ribbon domain-containing protein [Planctomycetota bacterium]
MPTYEYQCKTCGQTFDVFQSIKASPLRKAECETCGGKQPVRRLIGTGGALLFKGSGFYQTDYRSKSYQDKAKSETESKSGDSTKKESTTSDSKPAAAPKVEKSSEKPKKKD